MCIYCHKIVQTYLTLTLLPFRMDDAFLFFFFFLGGGSGFGECSDCELKTCNGTKLFYVNCFDRILIV